jgi:hypothetical protein
MKASVKTLKEALDRGSTIGVAEAYKELALKLEIFKAEMQTTLTGETVSKNPDGS